MWYFRDAMSKVPMAPTPDRPLADIVKKALANQIFCY